MSGGPPVASCLSASCGSSTPAVLSSYSALSTSLCSQYSSCVSAGSTGVLTVTATVGTEAFSGGGDENDPFDGNDNSGPFGGPFATGKSYSNWPSQGATTTFTVTGCPWETGSWFGNGGGSENGDGDDDGWGDSGWGKGGVWGGSGSGSGFWRSSQTGWAYRTATKTVTTTYTSAGSLVTATGIATVEEAALGTRTSTTTFFNAEATGTAGSESTGSSGGSASSGSVGSKDGLTKVKIVGLALGMLMVIVGVL